MGGFTLRFLWPWLRSQLWFGPALLTLAGVALALLLIELDILLDLSARGGWPTLGGGADGARGVLTAVASSVISVAGVAFSITVVAFALAAAQYSSRVLRNFMRDRTNQIVLGVLIATFAYCLVVLRTIHGDASSTPFVPTLAVFGGVALAFVALGHFVYFIHHIATSIQASHIVCAVAGETVGAMDVLFPQELGADEGEEGSDGHHAEAVEGPWRPVGAARTGYVQHVDEAALLAVACTSGRVLRMERGIGAFVIAGMPLVSVAGAAAPEPAVARRLRRAFTVSSYRTVDQDPAFGIRQLTDVALKALSPSVNDTTTALTCVDWLGAVMHRLVRRRLPSAARYDDDGRLRVLACAPTFAGLASAAFDPIRRNAEGNPAVLLRMVQVFEVLLGEVSSAARRRVLLEHVRTVAETARRTIAVVEDRQEAEAIASRLLATPGAPAAHARAS